MSDFRDGKGGGGGPGGGGGGIVNGGKDGGLGVDGLGELPTQNA